jgi:hypothetical protein
MSARFWNRAIALKIGVGFALAYAAPVIAVIADRARVTRNTIRRGRA